MALLLPVCVSCVTLGTAHLGNVYSQIQYYALLRRDRLMGSGAMCVDNSQYPRGSIPAYSRASVMVAAPTLPSGEDLR
jgi:hypothetical protein